MSKTEPPEIPNPAPDEGVEGERFFRVGIDMRHVANLDGFLLRVNPRWVEVLGWSEEELTSRPWTELVHPDDLERTTSAWQELVATQRTLDFANRLRTKDGSYRWIEWRAEVYPEEGLAYGTGRDVTREREAENALKESERRFRGTFEAAPIGIAHVGLDGSWLRINDALCRIVGYTREELLGRTFGDITHPDDLEADWALAKSVAAGEIPTYSMEKRYIRSDGSLVWVNLTVSMLRDERGEPVHYVSIVEDISERKQTAEALQESEDHFRFMVDSNLQVPWTADPDGKISDFSERWIAITGLTRDEAMGEGWVQVQHPDDLPIMTRAWSHSIRTGELYEVEHRVRMADGAYRWMHSRAVPRRDAEGKIVRWYGDTEDIHERRMVESRLYDLVHERTRELRAANVNLVSARDAALSASRAKSEFLANMSHEIRTPLNGVLGMTSLLLSSSLEGQALAAARTIASSGETLLRVIDDILDLSRIEAGRLDIERVGVDLAKIASDVVALYQEHARQKGLSLLCIGPSAAVPAVLADPVRLRQVLANLVSNAVKFTEQGSVELAWSWTLSDGNVDAVFKIVDTGIGISPDRLQAVFDSFTQADGSTQRRYGGSGLGLTISRQLVGLMGGQITVQSEVGKGTSFTVQLPLEVTDTRAQEEWNSEEISPVATSLRILLAEDNEVNVLVAQRMIEWCGCTADVAEDGLRAIAMCAENEYDLILMDVQMPLCDGLEATRAIRSREALTGGRRVPVVALTANAMREDRDECLAAGMDGFLAKPITLGALSQTLAGFAASVNRDLAVPE
ncbi:PAS domain-containing hybrid sensor histidine kinase/response regulator [Fimbriimonas ginsengisoli]|nr:PAS domain-containing hybrid sensor histidine kinase/response regulator [Fimbriimonas ginsengisoli]